MAQFPKSAHPINNKGGGKGGNRSTGVGGDGVTSVGGTDGVGGPPKSPISNKGGRKKGG